MHNLMNKIHFVKLDGDCAEFELEVNAVPMVGDTVNYDEDDFTVEKRVYFAERGAWHIHLTSQLPSALTVENIKCELAKAKAEIHMMRLIDLHYFIPLIQRNVHLTDIIEDEKNTALDEIKQSLFKFNFCENPELVAKLTIETLDDIVKTFQDDMRVSAK